jgi:paraquat-inducible protein B
VILDLVENRIREKGGTGQALQPKELSGLIHDGLRAQLSLENAITGLLYVELAFHPNTPPTLLIKPGTGRYPELPTVPAATEEIVKNVSEALARLAKIDFDSLAASLEDTALSVQEFAGNREFREAIATVNRVAQNPALKRSIHSAEISLGRVSSASLGATHSLTKSDAKLDAEIENLQKSSALLQTALLRMRSTMASAQLRIEPGSPMIQQFGAKLDELSETARSIHDIADYLQRNPGGLVRGANIPK